MAIGALLLAALPNSRAACTLPFYEPFGEYAEDENLGSARTNQSSGKIWTFGNTATDSSAKITANAALSYPGLPAEPNPFPKGIRANSIGKNRGVAFTEQTAGTVYASFLMQVTTLPEGPRIIACLSSTNQGVGVATPVAGVFVDTAGRLVLAKHCESRQPPPTNAPTTKVSVTNKVSLVVFSYTFNPDRSTPDVVSLWLNPTSLGDNSKVPPPTLTCSTGANAHTVQGFAYMAPTASFRIGLDMDEIRVATDWAGATSGTTFVRPKNSK